MYCVKWNRRIRYNTDLLAIHDEAFLGHSVCAARFWFIGKSHDFWCWKNFHWNFIAHRQPLLTGTPGSLKQKELLWSGWSTAPLLPFSFPMSHREVHKDSRVPARYIVADQTAGLTLEPLKLWKATQQRSPWAVPLTTAHARALTNEPRLPPQCVHIPTKGGRTTPLLEI